MSFVRAAAYAALASGAIVIGASCKPERLTSASREIDAAPALRASTSRGVKIASYPDTLQLGQTVQLSTQGGSSVTSQLKNTSSSTSTSAVTWVSLDSAVLRVTSTGDVTAIGGGNGRVVAQSSSQADTAKMYVVVAVASVVATPDNGSVTVGQTSQLTAVAKDALGQPVSGAPIAWSSSNGAVATVSPTGLVTGVAVGTAGIVAESNGHGDTVSVTVTAVPVASVAVAPTTVSVAAGATTTLVATAKDAAGATLAGRLITWTTSNAQVATVTADGVVSGVAAGTATVTATVDGKSASSAVTVTAATVASVAATVNTSSLTVGQTTQASATVKDASGATLTGRTVTWSSSSASVATVSSTGLVTAVAAGTTTLTATVDGVKGTVAVTVTNVAVASVTVAINSSTIVAGQTTQATATALDANNKPITGRTVTWSSSSTSIATVSSTGVVSGIAAGNATVTATVDGKSGQASLMVTASTTTTTPTAPAPVGGVATLPELPRAVVATSASATPSPGPVVRVPAGGDLQAALDNAAAGATILLAPGASYTGNFILRPKTGASASAWLTIATETTLPAPGTRVTPATAGNYAKILTPNVSQALATEGVASYIRLQGVEVGPAPGVGMVYGLITLGDANPTQSKVSQVPHHIVLDRVYVHGTSTLNGRRGIAINSAWTAIVNSYVSDWHSNDGDSQAIWGANGPGPFTIVNNYLEGAGENVMFGGSDAAAPELIPADITFTDNDVVKPSSWRGVWQVKNLFELKVGIRTLVTRNRFSGSWTSGQTGFALLFKSINQGGTAPWSETRDLTVTRNVITNSERGVGLAGNPEPWKTAVPMSKVLLQDMVLDMTALSTTQGLTVQGVADLTLDHLTLANGVQFNAEQTAYRFTMTANAIHVPGAPTCPADWYPCGGMIWSADNHGVGDEALAYHTSQTGYVVGNLIDGDRVGANRTPSTNGTPAPDAGARP